MKENKILKLIYMAWRERWTDSQFGINIKSVLPRGVSGDVYNLAECLVQQALIGSTANKLILNHLKHALCSHLVSHAAVLQSVAKFQQFTRIYCVMSLLEFLDSVILGICCRTKAEESLLPTALANQVLWLMKNIYQITKYYEARKELSPERTLLLEKASSCINKIVNSEYLMVIYYIGLKDSIEVGRDIFGEYLNIKSLLTETDFVFPQLITEENLHKLAYLDIEHFKLPPIDTDEMVHNGTIISYCVQPLLSAEVSLRPYREANYFVTELKMLQKLRRFSNTRLFYELLRACFMTISANDETSFDIMWGAFSYFKMPHILRALSDHYRSMDPKLPLDYAVEMVEAFEMIFEDSLLVDCFSTKCTEAICERFLKEWLSMSLINDSHLQKFMTKRNAADILQEDSEFTTQPSINLIIRAEVPLSGFLKTLNADYNKVQEALLGVLNQVLVGNSFELILSVAMVEGHIRTFVSRLIQCNENSTPFPSDINKHTIRSNLFDISFLMLTAIIQKYGMETVLPEIPGDSFFETWVRQLMFQKKRPLHYKTILDSCDEKIVDEVLNALMKPDTQINTAIPWQEICKNIPSVIYQILIAWESEALSTNEVKTILDNMKTQMLTYILVAVSFLCVYMDGVNENELQKPFNMMQQLLTHTSVRSPSSSPPGSEEESSDTENMNERLSLLYQIIRYFRQDATPPNANKSIIADPIEDRFQKVWRDVKTLGWLPVNVAKEMESVLGAAGPAWFTWQLVQEILKQKYTGDMFRTMDIVFGIFHLDIEETTAALIDEILPKLITQKTGFELHEPQTYILSRLAVHSMMSCLEMQQMFPSHKKRLRSVSSENEDSDSCKNAKQRKINSDAGDNSSCSNDFISDSNLLLGASATSSSGANNAGGPSGSGGNSNDSSSGSNDNSKHSETGNALSSTGGNNSNKNKTNHPATINKSDNLPPLILREPLESGVSKLFKLFHGIVSNDVVCPNVIFVYQFIMMLVQHGQERARPILRLLPMNILQCLLKLMSNEEVKVGLIARVHDLNSTTGRNQAVSDLSLLRNIQLKKFDSLEL